MGKTHGNSLNNKANHHLYSIDDAEEDDVFKYGISGEELLPNGTSGRANRQVKQCNLIAGKADKFTASVLETEIPGRQKALEKEQEYIDSYKQKNGRKPRGNV